MPEEYRGRQRSSNHHTDNRYALRSRELPGRIPPRKQRRRGKGKEASVALTVIAGVILCMVIVISVIWSASEEEIPSQQTLAAPVRSEMTDQPRISVGDDDPQAAENAELQDGEFRQLSDPFLVLVNDTVPLPDDWQVTPDFIGEQIVDVRISGQLNQMIRAAQEDGVWLWVASGYRSVEDQERVLNTDIQLHMNEGMSEDEARELSLRTINRPGHSEHHTGFVVDLNDVDDSFEETDAYRWLSIHAADYGFVQRYRSDKVDITGIDNESWHYRYVGTEHAQEMQSLDMCLEEYVQYLKDQGVQ